MQIILVHHRLRQARTLTLTKSHAALASLAMTGLIVMGAATLYYFTFRHAAEIRLPMIRELFLTATLEEQQKKDAYLRENLNQMAKKLGEMQAQLMRLDALGERVSGLAGVKPQEFNFREVPGRGGAMTSSRDLAMPELASQLDLMSRSVDQRSDYMTIVEAELLAREVEKKRIPTIQPVSEGFLGSGFGFRIDPITGRQALHEGIDFNAPVGTPIHAAAGGVVVAAEQHPAYGNMIEIDHGNDLISRYAHASRLLVKPGQIVKRGQLIAEVGTTGRSTGPHLHFEVHVKGTSVNPARFLYGNATPAFITGASATPAVAAIANASPALEAPTLRH